MGRESLSSIDRMWFRAEGPTHPMMITVLLEFEAPIEFERLHPIVRHRLLQFPRFRQRVVQAEGDLEGWLDDGAFDLAHHLKRVSLPAPGDKAALAALVSGLISEQLDLFAPEM